jgi:hypothetical protein
LWDVATGRPLAALHAGKSPLGQVVFSPDGALAATGPGGLWVWELRPWRNTPALARVAGPSRHIAFGPGHTILYADKEGNVEVRDRVTGKLRGSLRGLLAGKEVKRTAFSADGRTFAVAAEGAVQAADLFAGRVHPPFTPGCRIHGVAVSADGRTLALECDPDPREEPERQTRVWRSWVRLVESATGKERARFPLRVQNAWVPTFSPDGRILAFSCDGVIHLLDLDTGREVERLRGHQAGVRSLAFSRKGDVLVSGSHDTTALAWDLRGLRPRTRVRRLSAGELEALWADLASPDAPKAHRAVRGLADAGAARFLAGRLRREGRALARREKELARALADLDSPHFGVRSRAYRQLAGSGDLAEGVLRQALASRSAEVRWQAGRLLGRLEAGGPSPGVLRVLRALEALERLGGREALLALEGLAGLGGESVLSREARPALRRLAGRVAR